VPELAYTLPAITFAVVLTLPVKLAAFPFNRELTFTFGAVNVPERVMLAMPDTLCGRLIKKGTVP
jgi:hypothetical protein